MIWAAAFLGYVGATFVLSALTVRFLPASWTAKTIGRCVTLFPVLPALYFLNLLMWGEAMILRSGDALADAFEAMSGRKVARRQKASYYSYSERRVARGSSRRAPKRRSARAPKCEAVAMERREIHSPRG